MKNLQFQCKPSGSLFKLKKERGFLPGGPCAPFCPFCPSSPVGPTAPSCPSSPSSPGIPSPVGPTSPNHLKLQMFVSSLSLRVIFFVVFGGFHFTKIADLLFSFLTDDMDRDCLY